MIKTCGCGKDAPSRMIYQSEVLIMPARQRR
jgi:hypothetical protein